MRPKEQDVDENLINEATLQVFIIIKEILEGPTELTTDDAAHVLDNAFEEYCLDDPNYSIECFLYCFWGTITHLASEIPHDDPKQDKLVAIITDLKELDGRPVEIWDKQSHPWHRMPLFAEGLPCSWEALSLAKSEDEKRQKFVNIQAYPARVLGNRITSLESQAIGVLREAVEGAIIPVRGSPDIVSADPTAIKDVKFKTTAAAQWVIYAGHVLYGRDEVIGGTHGGPLWKRDKGKKGLCAGRWNLWKQQFGAIRDCGDIDAETREIAGKAVAAMEKAEQKAA